MLPTMSAMKFVASFVALGMCAAMAPKHRESMLSALRSKSSATVTPLEKVITLLEDLKKDIEDEAKEEAKTYDKFACFCKDTTTEKSDAIKEGYTVIDDQTAIIEEKTAEQEKKTRELKEFQKRADEIAAEIKKEEAARAKEKAEFEAIIADLELALRQMEKAIEVLESSKPSLLEVKETIRKSLVFADALGLASKHVHNINAFLQGTEESSEDPPGEYEFKSDGIIDAIKDLEKEMKEHKEEKEKEEEKAAKAHEKLMEEKNEMLKTQEEGIKECEEAIDKCKEAISEAEIELGNAEAEMKDNQLYLKDLTERCESKAKTWDQRSKMRADEVEALTKALETLKDDKIKEAKRALLQGPKESALISQSVVLDQDAAQDASDGAGAGEDDIGSSALSFMQRESPTTVIHRLLKSQEVKSAGQTSKDNLRAKAVALLTSEGQRLKSTLLVSTASKVEALIGPDPFKKVKQLIQTLIERLLQEMKDEATHKGFCDEEMGKAKNTRDSAHAKTEKLNAEIMQLEVRKDTASETIDTLTDELEDLNSSLEKSTKMREEEKEENAVSIKDAKEGAEAVAEAIKILKDFYAKAAKGFLQASPIDEEGENPGAGFEGNYKGKQDAAGGIIGMLEVIQSDFERAERQTAEAEATSHRSFVAFERQTKVSIGEKETGKGHAETDLKSTKIALKEATSDFEDTQKLLDETLKELEELNPQCVDTGMSYEERVAAREEEIKALKKALDILAPP